MAGFKDKEVLSQKERRFVDLWDGNATKTAIRAGYSEKSAYSYGSRIMARPRVAQAIKEQARKFGDAVAQASAQELVKEVRMTPADVMVNYNLVFKQALSQGDNMAAKGCCDSVAKIYSLFPKEKEERQPGQLPPELEIYRPKWLTEAVPADDDPTKAN